jgi:hypothetical protein
MNVMRAGPQLGVFTHPGASANLTAQQWGCKQPRCVRLLRLWPTLYSHTDKYHSLY